MAKHTFLDKAAWDMFVHLGEVLEVRIPKIWGKSSAWSNDIAKGIVSGYFDDHKSFFKSVREPYPNFTTIAARLGNGGHMPFFINPIFFERNCQ